jgi:hypothetical protein
VVVERGLCVVFVQWLYCNRSFDGRIHYQLFHQLCRCIIIVKNVLVPHLLVTVPGKRERVYCIERSKE